MMAMMTLTQTIKSRIYPAIMAAGKWFSFKGRYRLNQKFKAPLTPLYALQADTNFGRHIHLETYRGKYLLISNTASHCGYTAQYAELQQLQDRYPQQLQVLAFPANDFGGQEPGNDDAIANFCAVNFGVQFPVMMKTSVIGGDKHPIFEWLTNPAMNGWNKQAPTWNFCKYLINPDGVLLGFFESGISPLAQEITTLIQ